MILGGGRKKTSPRFVIEVPHTADECLWVMDEIIGRGPQYQRMFNWGCGVGEHNAWTVFDAPSRGAALEEALPPVLRERAVVHRVSRIDGSELHRLHDEKR